MDGSVDVWVGSKDDGARTSVVHGPETGICVRITSTTSTTRKMSPAARDDGLSAISLE